MYFDIILLFIWEIVITSSVLYTLTHNLNNVVAIAIVVSLNNIIILWALSRHN